MRIWLTKPFYESLPYLYLLAGVLLLLASLYLDYWYWPTLCLIAGMASLAFGLFVFLQRRDFRRSTRGRKAEGRKNDKP